MSKIKADTLSNLAGSKEVPVDTVVQGSAKAWVNFNGTGTIAIRTAFNVSSITDNAVGFYTLNLTNPLPDGDCVVVGGSNNATSVPVLMFDASRPNTASAINIQHLEGGGAGDVTIQTVVVFR